MRFRLLGPLQVATDAGWTSIRAAQQRVVLALLLLRAGQVVTTDRLIDELWGERPPATATNTVQAYVMRLRRVVSDPQGQLLVTRPPGYLVAVDGTEVDVRVFDLLVAEGQQSLAAGRLESAAEQLSRALALWQGPALADVPATPTVAAEAAQLERRRQIATEARLTAELRLGRHAELVAELSALVAEQPLAEGLRGQLMLALYRSGRRTEALHAYRQGRAQLVEELGVEPSRSLTDLHQAILDDNPERVANVGLPAESPVQVRSAAVGPPCQLPPDVVDFTGRDHEVGTVVDTIAPGPPATAVRIVAITGQGGIGKTTLAVHVAHRLRDAFPDGQFYVDLHGTDGRPADAAEVLAGFLTALGMDGRALPAGLAERTGSFRTLLADRRILLVLDNAASEQQLRPLLPGSPGCAVLVTSRRRLAGLSANRLALSKLDTDSALTLLGRIAGPHRVAAEPAAARKIVRLCDHLPLAVRIAGARIADGVHSSLDQLAERLDDEARRLDELAAGDLAVRTSLGASYDALTPAARRTFRLLGLLDTADFAAWVPAALLDTTIADAEAHLDALIDVQLLVGAAPGRPRFGMHDLVRLYARERSRTEDTERHRTAALARALGGWLALADAADRSLPERAAADVPGTAPRWSPDLATTGALVADPVAWFDGERAALVAAVRQAAGSGFDELAWELSARAVSYFVYRGHYDDWLHTHEVAHRACVRAGNRLGAAVLARNLGLLRMTGVRIPPGVDLGAALRTFQRLGHRHGEVDVLGMLAFARRHAGDIDGAVAYGDAAMAAAEAIDYQLGQCRLWYLRAVVGRERGDFAAATLAAERCLGLAETIGTASDRVLALWELAGACRDPEAAGRAARLLGEGIEVCRRRRERLLEAYLHVALGDLRLRLGQDIAAQRDVVEQAVSVFDQHGVLFGQMVGLRLLGELEQAGGEDAGIVHLERSVELAGQLGNERERARTLKALAGAHHAGGRYQAAGRAWCDALDLFERLGDHPEAAAVRALLRQLDGLHEGGRRCALPSDGQPAGLESGAGVPQELPPAERGPRQLPAAVPGFAGRAAELSTLDSLLGINGPANTPGIMVITGTAGVGKTALAVHWGHRAADRFRDGQLYVNLRGFHPHGSSVSPAEALRRFLDALGVAPDRIPPDPDARAALYRDRLAGKRMLVVLDNARDADQVRPLLPATPGCVAVVTSRNRLSGLVAIDGAHPLGLDLLTTAEARGLLAGRLGAGRVGAEPEAVAEIIDRCARLPLALAIAAARAAAHPRFPLAALAKELREARGGLDPFAAGDDASADVRAVFSWSYHALSTAAAGLFRLLAVHPGPDVSAAAVASLAAESHPGPLLAELTRAHLATEHVPGRYTCHDLLRAYATELAETVDPPTERRAATHRLLDHYLHTGQAAALALNPNRQPITVDPPAPGVAPEPITGHDHAMAWFTAEHPVLLAAVRHADAAGFDTHTWQLAWALDTFVQRHGLWHDQIAAHEAGLAAAERLGDRSAQAYAHRGLGLAHATLRRNDGASVHLHRALELVEALGEESRAAYLHMDLCWLAELQGGRYETGLRHAEEALRLYRAAGHETGQANALNAIGWSRANLGEHPRALAHCRQALELHQKLGNREGQAAAWDSLGYIHHQLGDHEQAIGCYRRALELIQTVGDRYYEASAYRHLGDTHHASGDYDDARAAWQQAQRILEELDHPDAEQVRDKLNDLAAARR